MNSAESSGQPAVTPLAANDAPPLVERNRLQRARLPVMIGVVLLAVIFGLVVYLTGGRYVSTDDAEIKGARVWISPSVSGRVVALKVHEGQMVHAGDVLFQLDARPYQNAFDEAQADVVSARSQIEGLRAAYRQRLAEAKAAEDSLAYLQGEAERQKALVAAGTSSGAQQAAADSQVDQARQKVAAAHEQVANAIAALGGDPSSPIDRHPLVLQARARLETARLNKSYVDIVAPMDGTATRVHQLEIGDYVAGGSSVFSLVSTHLWVEANFKENQLEYMRRGQAASIKIDTYPDRTFEGRIDSISPGTASSYSVLPAENATGNWVKVTQRVPVEIRLVGDIQVPLRAGLSASVKVDTGHSRSLFGSGSHAAARP